MGGTMLALLLLLLLPGCKATMTPTAPLASVFGSATSPPSAPVVPPSVPPLTSVALAEAKRFRQDFGLRADDAWILQVAADPSAADEYGVPLTPEEGTELDRRAATVEPMRAVIAPYGQQHPGEYAGVWIDQTKGGMVIAQFTRRIDQHRAALAGQMRPGAPLEVREVKWTLAELTAMAGRLRGADRWFASIDAFLLSVGVDVATNRVKIEISSANPEAADEIAAHFGLQGKVLVVSDGTGAGLLPYGSLLVKAVDDRGKPVPGLDCIFVADLPGAHETPIPPPRTDRNGSCSLEVPATGYWIRLQQHVGNQRSVAGLSRVVVSPDTTTRVSLRVEVP
jgi:hypothetical protein